MWYDLRQIIQVRLLAVLLLLCNQGSSVIGQIMFGASNDGNVFVYMKYLGDSVEYLTQTLNYGVQTDTKIPVKKFQIECLNLDSRKKLSQISFSVRADKLPDTLAVSPRGDNFYLKIKNHYLVFNAFTGKLIGDYFYPSKRVLYYLSKRKDNNEEKVLSQKAIAFPNMDNTYLVRHETMLVYYDSHTGNPVDTCTGFSKNAAFYDLYFTKGDFFLIAKDHKLRSYIWKVGQRKILLRQSADQFAFSQDNKSLYALKKTNKSFRLTTYSLPDGNVESLFRKNNLLKYYPPPASGRSRLIVYYPKKQIFTRFSSLSPHGKYLLVGFDYDRLSDYYMFINIDSYERVSHFDELKMGKKGRSLHWINDDIIEIAESEFSSRWIEIPYVSPPKYVNYRLKSGKIGEELPVSLRRLEKASVLSSTKDYKALPVRDRFSNSTIFFETDQEKGNVVYISDCEFVRFTTDGQYAVLLGPNTVPVKIKVEELIMNGGEIGPDYFIEFTEQGTARVSEKWIKDDSKPPKGYKYHQLDTIVPILEIVPGTKLNLVQKAVLYEDTTLTLQVHLLDEKGNFYSGAGTEDLEDFWCGLYTEGPDSTMNEVESYDVVEFTNETKSKDAIALVLDHSGSMGNERSLDIQIGAKAFIKMKNKEDAIALVKYDHYIGVESYLTNNKNGLLDSLKLYGILGYGGNTALLDGINTGISLLRTEQGYARKAVVIMTDGMENSSRINEKEVLQRALQNNISIFTIGFGHRTDDSYLESISQLTGGSFYKIYKTSDLTWIFEDIYKRINNYYEIKFNLTSIGIHRFILKVCYENSKPLIVEYDNTPLPPYEYIDTATFTLKPPAKIQIYDSVIIDEPEIENINLSLPPIPIEKFRKGFIFDTIEILEDFKYVEFPNIRFVFDKTDIIPGTDRGIENVVDFLDQHPALHIEVIGHTDSLGIDEYNMDLSIRRAKKVKSLLVDRGISPMRISVSGQGETQPILSSNNYWRRTYNRRVEFQLIFPSDKRKKTE